MGFKVRITDADGEVHEDDAPAGPLEIVKNFVFLTLTGMTMSRINRLIHEGDNDPYSHRAIRKQLTSEFNRLDMATKGFTVKADDVTIEVYDVTSTE